MTSRFLAALALVLQFGLGGAPQQKAVVEGSVSNSSTGQPVAGARVTLVQAGEFQPTTEPVITDHNGRFSIQVKEGAYAVRVEANGYVARFFGQRVSDGPPIDINVAAGQIARNVNFRLMQAANVSGRVRDETDRPLVNVPVQLLRYAYTNEGERTYESHSAVETDDRGQFRMYWVTPGRYYVLAGRPTTGGNPLLEIVAMTIGGMNASGNRVPPVNGHAFYPGVADIANARPLDLQPGSDIQAIDITMAAKPRTYSLRGKLIDAATGQPPAQARVFVVSQSAGLGATNFETALGMPNQNYDAQGGKIDVRGLSPGTYNVFAITRDPLADTRAGPSPQSTGATVVSITNSDVEDVVLSVSPAASITGRLRVDGQVPANSSLESLRVRLLPTGAGSGLVHTLRYQLSQAAGSAEFYNSTPIGPDGTFRLNNLVPGEYRIDVSGELMGFPGGNGYIREARFEGADILSDPMRFSGTVKGGLDVVIAMGGGKLSGSVTDARSQPVAGQLVVLVPERARFRRDIYLTTTTNQEGLFSLPGIVPGDYKVFAWESIEPFAWFDPEVLAKFDARGRTVRITETSNEKLDLRIIPADGAR